MSKMDSLCKIRDIYRAIATFEAEFEKHYNLSLNEGMLLCTLSKAKTLSSCSRVIAFKRFQGHPFC